MYTFRKASKEEKNEMRTALYGGKWIFGTQPSGEEKYARFLGQMMALFGEPDYLDRDWENMYSYGIIAEDENGGKFLLEIYHGPGGSSISMPTEHNNIDLAPYKQAAKELVEKVLNAVPADYEWESVYEDVGVTIRYIVKDGEVRVENEFPEDFDM